MEPKNKAIALNPFNRSITYALIFGAVLTSACGQAAETIAATSTTTASIVPENTVEPTQPPTIEPSPTIEPYYYIDTFLAVETDEIPEFSNGWEIREAIITIFSEVDSSDPFYREIQEVVSEFARTSSLVSGEDGVDYSTAVLEIEGGNGEKGAIGLVVDVEGNYYFALSQNNAQEADYISSENRGIFFWQGAGDYRQDGSVNLGLALPDGAVRAIFSVAEDHGVSYISPFADGTKTSLGSLEDLETQAAGMLAPLVEAEQPLEIIEFMANGEMVEGRVFEISELWEGEIPPNLYATGTYHIWGVRESFVDDRGLHYRSIVFGFLRQYRVVEFDLQDGGIVKQMLFDMVYANYNGEETFVRFRIGDIDLRSDWYPIVNNPHLGSMYTVVFSFIPPESSTTSLDLINGSLGQGPCTTFERCALDYGGVGDIKLSIDELINILDRGEGEFVDLSNSTVLSNVDN
ncbi:MAG: hypothetical protein FVQ83_07140 [Chloroflexi bacterium]|nr:hypothetical protein [Chloroflexota bacterium]